jgi:hypothetical protein
MLLLKSTNLSKWQQKLTNDVDQIWTVPWFLMEFANQWYFLAFSKRSGSEFWKELVCKYVIVYWGTTQNSMCFLFFFYNDYFNAGHYIFAAIKLIQLDVK